MQKVILFRITTETLLIFAIILSITQLRPIVKFPRLPFILLLYTLVFYLTSFMGVDFSQSFFGEYYRNQGFLTLIHYVLFYLIIGYGFTLGIKKKQIVYGFVFSSFILSLISVFQFLFHTFLNTPVLLFNERYVVTFGNPNFFGAYLALTIPCFCYLFFPFKTIKKAFLFFITIFIQFIGIYLSGSRGAMIGGIIGVLLYFFFSYRSQLSKPLKFILIGLSFLFVLLLSYTSLSTRTSIYGSRGDIWRHALEAGIQRPIFGYGLENFEFAIQNVVTNQDIGLLGLRIDKAHNEVLELFVSGGIVGLSVFLFIVFSFFKSIFHKVFIQNEETPWNIFLFTTMVVFLFISLTNVLSVSSYLIFWMVLALSNDLKTVTFTITPIYKLLGILMVCVLLFLIKFNIRNSYADTLFNKGVQREQLGLSGIAEFKNAYKIFPWERLYKFKSENSL